MEKSTGFGMQEQQARFVLSAGGVGKPCAFANLLLAKEAAPILKKYIKDVVVVRPFFDVTPKSSLTDFEREAPRHPVFRIVATTQSAA